MTELEMINFIDNKMKRKMWKSTLQTILYVSITIGGFTCLTLSTFVQVIAIWLGLASIIKFIRCASARYKIINHKFNSLEYDPENRQINIK